MNELNIYDKAAYKKYKKAETFRIATGIVSIAAAIVMVCLLFLSSSFSVYLLFLSVIFSELFHYPFFHYPSGTVFILLLYQIAMLTAMIICAIYAFAVYGKKHSYLWGVAISIFAIGHILFALFALLSSSLISTSAIIGVIFLIMALQYFKKTNTPSKVLPIIASVLAIAQNIFGTIPVGGFLFQWLSFIPFLLFALFCPVTHKRIKRNAVNSHLQQREMILGDLTSQLQYLKGEFDSGKISQQEYEYKRKSLVDKL
ncbi:MAG: hypothetical protein FWH17_04940 [Oscillospiraceae bacterium]|nr:hypothetical protein [Oscillospiraceae bacterium]